MRFQFSFKHMDASSSLQDYAEDKLRVLIDKFVTKPVEAHVTFSIDNHTHIAHCSLMGGDGFSLQVEHSCSDMYGSVDKMLDKLAGQLKKKKDKLKTHKGNRSANRGKKHGKDRREFDIDSAEIDAADIIKYEKARNRKKLSTG